MLFLLVAGAIAGQVEISGIHNTSTQADKKIVDALLDAGADVQVSADKVFVKKTLEAFTFNATDCPDLFLHWLHWLLIAKASPGSGLEKIET